MMMMIMMMMMMIGIVLGDDDHPLPAGIASQPSSREYHNGAGFTFGGRFGEYMLLSCLNHVGTCDGYCMGETVMSKSGDRPMA